MGLFYLCHRALVGRDRRLEDSLLRCQLLAVLQESWHCESNVRRLAKRVRDAGYEPHWGEMDPCTQPRGAIIPSGAKLEQ